MYMHGDIICLHAFLFLKSLKDGLLLEKDENDLTFREEKAMVKRIIGILLSFCMTVVLVSGCGESAEKTDTADNSAGKSTISAESSSELLTITVVEVPKLAKEQVIVMDAVSLSVKAEANALIWTEKLIRAAEDEGMSEEDKIKVLDSFIEAWEIADNTANKAEKMADLLIQAEALPEYNGLMGMGIIEDADGNLYCSGKSLFNSDTVNPFVMQVYDAENSTKIDAKAWAENITKAYNDGKNGQKLETIANLMGLNGEDKEDCKKAYKALVTAQGIMKGVYEGEQAEKEAATWNNIYNTAKVLKSAGKVAAVGVSVATMGSASGITGALEIGGTALDGLDAVLDVADTGATLILGEDNHVSASAQAFQDKLGPVSSVVGGINTGKTLVGLNWKGGFEAINKGLSDNDGLGTLSYIGNSIYDYVSEGKLVGGAIVQETDGSFKLKLAEIYTTAKPEEKKEIEEQLKKEGFSESFINSLGTASDQTTQEAAICELSEMSPEQLEEYAIITDVLSEQNNPEQTIDDLAKELEKIIEETYSIVVKADTGKLAGIYEGKYIHNYSDKSVQNNQSVKEYPAAVFVADDKPIMELLIAKSDRNNELLLGVDPEALLERFEEITYDSQENAYWQVYYGPSGDRIEQTISFTESEDGEIRMNFYREVYDHRTDELYLTLTGEYFKVSDSYDYFD
jgi:hypothetical protein